MHMKRDLNVIFMITESMLEIIYTLSVCVFVRVCVCIVVNLKNHIKLISKFINTTVILL